MYIDFRDKWLSKIGERIGIPELAFDTAGLCRLSLDDELVVTIYKPAETENLVLFGQIPINDVPAELMQLMLVENRNHSKYTAPVISLISLSEQQEAIEIHFKFTQLELEATENAIDQLIGNLEYWRNCLTRF